MSKKPAKLADFLSSLFRFSAKPGTSHKSASTASPAPSKRSGSAKGAAQGSKPTSQGKARPSAAAKSSPASAGNAVQLADLKEIGLDLDPGTLPAPSRADRPRIVPVLEVHPSAPPSNLLPIVLSTKRAVWRKDDQSIALGESVPEEIKKKVLTRDGNACRYCGFRSPAWQEVHHLNDDFADNRLQNLATICHFCHSCWHLGVAGAASEARLVWLPWIGQAALNHLVRSIIIAEADGGRSAEGAKALFLALKEAARGAEERLGTSDPTVLSNALLALPEDRYVRRGDMLDGIRLLNLGKVSVSGQNKLAQVVTAWRTERGPYAALPPSAWDRLRERADREIAATLGAKK